MRGRGVFECANSGSEEEGQYHGCHLGREDPGGPKRTQSISRQVLEMAVIVNRVVVRNAKIQQHRGAVQLLAMFVRVRRLRFRLGAWVLGSSPYLDTLCVRGRSILQHRTAPHGLQMETCPPLFKPFRASVVICARRRGKGQGPHDHGQVGRWLLNKRVFFEEASGCWFTC